MTHTAKLIVLALAAPITFFGCAADTSSELIEPTFDSSKADGFEGVEDGGTLLFGDAVESTFDRDFQFYSYTFDAREDAVITADITRRGSSSRLDTTLFLYRINDGQEPTRIGSDDDEGWGRLSRIRDFRLFSEGRYAVVVGTRGAEGRGNFRLELRCESGECGPVLPPEEACPVALRDAMFECLEEAAHETDFEMPLDEVRTEWCATTEDLEVLRENACPAGAAWCDDADAIHSCQRLAESLYPAPPRSTSFRSLDNDDLTALVDVVYQESGCNDGSVDAGCTVELFAGEYDPSEEIPLHQLMADARGRSWFGPGICVAPSEGPDAYENFLRYHRTPDLFDAYFADRGLDLRDARIVAADTLGDLTWVGVNCTHAILIVDFPEAGETVEFQSSFCFD